MKFTKTVNPLILKGFLFFLMEFGCKYALGRGKTRKKLARKPIRFVRIFRWEFEKTIYNKSLNY